MPIIDREPVAPKDVKIHVVVPFYNCYGRAFIHRCLRTIQDQVHPHVNVVVIDDASDDGSSWYAEGICKELGWTYHRNDTNLKCPHNIWLGVQKTRAELRDVIFLLDGDDYLPHERVLSRVAEIFAEADTWMTFGQYMSDPPDYHCAPAIPPTEHTVRHRTFRTAPMFFNHPIIFRRFLFDSILESEFKDKEGNWFQAGYDRTIIYPLLERATGETYFDKFYGEELQRVYWRFINEVLYVYNSENPQSEWRVVSAEARHVDQIHLRPPLTPLKVRAL